MPGGVKECLLSYLSSFVRSTNSNMKTAIYARVFTSNGQSPEMQLAELREYVSRRGWEVFAEYVDSGIRLESGKTGISRIGDQRHV